ncbi:MAG TPA: hypothetical protein VFZ91_01360 [Allosphingosinicella sp.]
MAALGLLILGAFVGYIILHGLRKITDWGNPVATINGVLSAAVAGGLFTLISESTQSQIGEDIYFYPVGLGYGALCRGLEWVGDGNINFVKGLHLAAFGLASLLVLLLMFYLPARQALP